MLTGACSCGTLRNLVQGKARRLVENPADHYFLPPGMEADQEGKQLSSPGEKGSCPLLYLTWRSTNGGQLPLVLHVWRRGEKKGAGEERGARKRNGGGEEEEQEGEGEEEQREIFFSIVILNMKVMKTHPVETQVKKTCKILSMHPSFRNHHKLLHRSI